MKKIIAAVMVWALCLFPMTAFAAEGIPAETQIMMGDVNGDKKVSADDARAILRMSAKLDSADGFSLLSTDANADGELTAADARLVLRVAANLSRFGTGFDGEGTANAILALRSGKYSISLSVDDTKFSITKEGQNIYISSDDMMSDIDMMGMKIQQGALLVMNNDFYLVCVMSGGQKIAMYLPENMLDQFGISLDELTEIVNLVAQLVPSEYVTPVKASINGNDRISYSYLTLDAQCILYTNMSGNPISIDTVDAYGNSISVVEISSFRAEISDDCFDLSSYEIM